jgi:hypothetical protein
LGTGGVSVSSSGLTLTVYGLSTAILLNDVSEGTSNFYYRPSRFVGTGGASVSVSGLTTTIYAGSTLYAGYGISIVGQTIGSYNITISGTTPTSPATNDLWINTA